MPIDLLIPGLPRPQGSKRHVGNGVIVDANAQVLAPWRATIASAVFHGKPEGWLMEGPMHVSVAFVFPYLKRHRHRTEAIYKATQPDIDKLLRAVLDACTDGGAWYDDAQVCSVQAWKVHADEAGIRLVIRHVEERKG